MEEVDRKYWLDRDLWTQVEACLLAYDEDPRTYQFKPHPPQTGSLRFVYGRPYELIESDPVPWAKLYHRAKDSMEAGTLPYVGPQHGRKFRPPEFLRWAQGKGVALPDWLAEIASPHPAESESPGTLLRSPASIARRDPGKLDTQKQYKAWQKAYREGKRKHSDKSDVWHSKQIAMTDIANGHASEYIRKHMKKLGKAGRKIPPSP
jgi:hypothetical protein